MQSSSASFGSLSPSASRQFNPRSVLPERLDYLWHIETGFVRSLTWLEDGTIVVLGIWSAGDVVGQALSKQQPYQLECLTQVTAHLLPIQQCDQNSELLLRHIQQCQELMTIRSYKRVDLMLLKLLNWLAKRFGKQVSHGHLINLRLTHQDLAELLGSTRVTITRILNQLEQQGLIQRLSLQRIVVPKEELWHYEI